MKTYLFILGRDKNLSILELVSYFLRKNINYKMMKISGVYAEVQIEDFDCKKAINELGGIIKIAEFFDLSTLKFEKNKILFCLNIFYNDIKLINQLYSLFKEQRVKALQKKPKKEIFSPKESRRFDLELFIFKNRIAKVIVNSNPSEFKERDEKRPFFDKLKVTSLRLSKILVNLSQVKENELLLDPFVGAGSILQEAMLMKINVIGTDIDEKSVEGTIRNLDWIKNKCRLKANFKVYNIDNKDLDKVINYVDVVATEPYFGPFFKKFPKYEDVLKIIEEIEELYYDVLLKLKKIVKKNSFIVFPVPLYKTTKGDVTLDFESILKEIGFEIYSPIDSIKMPIKYSVKGNIVERLIYILKNP
jgi:tRNA G10  N-methylase Trm11